MPPSKVRCPICMQSVSALKSNSHIIPRWAIKKIKSEGKNILVRDKSVKINNQTDFKGGIVCKECENRFTGNDNFAKDFFDNNKFLEGYEKSARASSVEKHSLDCYQQLKSFSLSILLRQHLYTKKYEDSDLLGSHFNGIRKRYVDEVVRATEYPTYVVKSSDSGNMVGYPTKTQEGELGCIFFQLLSYRVCVYTNLEGRIPPPLEHFFLTPKRVLVIVVPTKKSKFIRDLYSLLAAKA